MYAKKTVGESYFRDHEMKMDFVLCIEEIIFLIVIFIGLFIEYISKNINLMRGDFFSRANLIAAAVFLIVTIIIGITGRNTNRPWFKYLVSFAIAYSNLVMSFYSMFGVAPLLIIPIFSATFYYDCWFVGVNTILSTFVRIAGITIYSKIYLEADFDFTDNIAVGIKSKMVIDILNLTLLLLTGILCFFLSRAMKKFIEDRISREHEKAMLDRDMSTAGKIQMGMLPKKFPVRKEFDVSAFILPAKMVGGDFFDFIELENDRVALVIADVSGKGLQASLYMSQAKALFNVFALSGYSPDKIIEKTNAYLTSNAGFLRYFVTAWVGILDLRTGMLFYTNAGHNPPCIAIDGKPYELMSSRVNFVVGGKPFVKYLENQIKLKPGDKIFLYTDGVTEAKNEEELFYTEQALLDVLNTRPDASSSETIERVKESLNKYSGNAEQYDDITMLAFSFREFAVEKEKKGKTFTADRASFEDAMSYIRSECQEIGCSDKNLTDIEISSSEIIANICSYAYPENEKGDFEVLVEEDGRDIRISFIDSGIPYNPLLTEIPDTTKKLNERKAGGLGVFIVKKYMNDVLYKYENGRNILVIIKQIR